MKNFVITIFVMVGLILGLQAMALTFSPAEYIFDSNVEITGSCDSGGTAFRYFTDPEDCLDNCEGATGCENFPESFEADLNEGHPYFNGTPPFEILVVEYDQGEFDVCDSGTYQECITASPSEYLDEQVMFMITPVAGFEGFGMEITSVSVANIMDYSNNLFGSIAPLLALIIGFPLAFWLINRVMDLVKVRINKNE